MMVICETIESIQSELKNVSNKRIGFVPTMGFLHEGHLSLVEQAKIENDIVVMSIFVNPLQFGPNEDFERYPRNEEHDMRVSKNAGVDYLFIPAVNEMYPEQMGIEFTVTKGTDVLCGRSRPGHFDGVATVLTKLFHIIQPTTAYFGLKDAQQFSVVHTLISQLNFPIQLVGLPTVRESDGLAKSSRNVYLSSSERKEAVFLHSALQYGKKLIVDGTKNPDIIVKEIKHYLLAHTRAEIEYVELLSYPSLETVSIVEENIILAVAAKFEKARLIDNILLTCHGEQIDKIDK